MNHSKITLLIGSKCEWHAILIELSWEMSFEWLNRIHLITPFHSFCPRKLSVVKLETDNLTLDDFVTWILLVWCIAVGTFQAQEITLHIAMDNKQIDAVNIASLVSTFPSRLTCAICICFSLQLPQEYSLRKWFIGFSAEFSSSNISI